MYRGWRDTAHEARGCSGSLSASSQQNSSTWVGGKSYAVIQTCPDLRWLLFGLCFLTALFLLFLSWQAHILAVSP